MAKCGGSHLEEQTRLEEVGSWWHSPWKGGDGRRWGSRWQDNRERSIRGDKAHSFMDHGTHHLPPPLQSR